MQSLILLRLIFHLTSLRLTSSTRVIHALWKTVLVCMALLYSLPLGAQPRWFWEADRCNGHTVGYAIHSYVYPDSSLKQAAINGAINRSIQSRVRIEGTLAFRQSPIGTYTVKNDIIETYDEERALNTFASVAVQSSFRMGNAHIALIGEGPCEAADVNDDSGRSKVEPEWIQKPPKKDGFIYAVGISPGYYYSANAWLDAEKDARLQLAWSLESKILADTYTSTTYREELQVTELAVTLSGIEVIARYHDAKRNAYHVLARIPSAP